MLFTLPVGCSRLPSAVNDPATTIFFTKKYYELQQFCPTATTKNWKKKTDATFIIDRKKSVLVVLLLIRGGDGSLMWLVLGSLIGVSSVHFCLMCSVRFSSFSYIFRTLQTMDNRSGLPVPIYPLRCTSPRSSKFWVANHDMLNLVGSDREFIQISFWDISSAHCGPQTALSVRRFCRAEHRGVSPSWWCSAELRKHPVAIDKNFDWVRLQPRDVQRCKRSLLDSNKQSNLLSIALLELFPITRITLNCPFHESSLPNRHWMGCRSYFAANRLEVLLNEDNSRSSSRVREHGSFLLVSQLHVAIQTLWSQCLFPRAAWTNRWIVHFQRVAPF